MAAMRGAPPRGPALRDQDLRLDLQEPRRPAGRGPQRRPAARGRRLPRTCGSAAPASPRSTPTSSRTPATRRTADVLELMAVGPPAGPRAVRGRARARGPGARRGRAGPTAGSCEAGRIHRRCRGRWSPRRSTCFVIRDKTVAPTVSVPRPVAAIGIGSDAVGVDSDGPMSSRPAGPRRRVAAAAAADRTAEERPASRARARTGPGPRRGAGGAAALSASSLLRRKRGRASSSARGSNCASATRPQAERKWRAAAAVLADPDHRARLCRPARAAKARRRRLWAYSAARRINPRPQAQTGQTLK